jgi:hypothetical protein
LSLCLSVFGKSYLRMSKNLGSQPKETSRHGCSKAVSHGDSKVGREKAGRLVDRQTGRYDGRQESGLAYSKASRPTGRHTGRMAGRLKS